MPGLKTELDSAVFEDNLPELNRLLKIEGIENLIGAGTLSHALMMRRFEVAKRLIELPNVISGIEKTLVSVVQMGDPAIIDFLLSYPDIKTKAMLIKPKLLDLADKKLKENLEESETPKLQEIVKRLESLPSVYRSLIYGAKNSSEKPVVSIDDPLLFRASKSGEKSFLVLGTSHGLGIESFSKEVKALLQEQKALLIEKLKFTVAEMAPDLLLISPELLYRKPTDPNQWQSLPSRDQEVVKTVLKEVQEQLVKIGKDISDLKDDMIFGMFYGTLISDCGEHSMDVQLRNFYSTHNRQAIGLELPTELLSQIEEFRATAPSWLRPAEFYTELQSMAISNANTYAKRICF